MGSDQPNDHPSATDRIIASTIERALPYLAADGRAWMDGQVDIQDGQNCVSCHQVPSGIWSQDAAYRALNRNRSKEWHRLIDDAADFISDPTVGRPAMWAQLLVVINAPDPADDDAISTQTRESSQDWAEGITSSQQADGRWASKGQFPAQRRSIDESDAVITMWMLAGLQGYAGDHEKLPGAIRRATEFICNSKGETTEWIAWKAITFLRSSQEESRVLMQELIDRQHQDGGWSWKIDDPSDPYSTGVALYALAISGLNDESFSQARAAATNYLVSKQLEDGTWEAPSRFFTKTESKSRDYVYQYWGTAWATLGLATELNSRGVETSTDSGQ